MGPLKATLSGPLRRNQTTPQPRCSSGGPELHGRHQAAPGRQAGSRKPDRTDRHTRPALRNPHRGIHPGPEEGPRGRAPGQPPARAPHKNGASPELAPAAAPSADSTLGTEDGPDVPGERTPGSNAASSTPLAREHLPAQKGGTLQATRLNDTDSMHRLGLPTGLSVLLIPAGGHRH